MRRGDLTADDQTAMLADRYTQRAEVYDALWSPIIRPLTSDVAAAPNCSAACLTHWPPLLATRTPVLPSGVSGTLTVVQNSNGSQVAYNGRLLYLFANDKA
jgi:hypothetical protein